MSTIIYVRLLFMPIYFIASQYGNTVFGNYVRMDNKKRNLFESIHNHENFGLSSEQD